MTRTCARCGRENPYDSRFCNACGLNLSASEIQKSAASDIKCSKCGEMNEPFRRYCKNCSEDLSIIGVQKELGSRYCAWCGSPVPMEATMCGKCGQNPAGVPEAVTTFRYEPAEAELELGSRPKTSKPIWGGLLLIIAGISEIVSGIVILSTNVSSSPAAIGVSPEVISAAQNFVAVCGSIVFILGLVAAFGGAFAINRKHPTLAIVASVFGLAGLGFYYTGSIASLIALILLAISREEFSE